MEIWRKVKAKARYSSRVVRSLPNCNPVAHGRPSGRSVKQGRQVMDFGPSSVGIAVQDRLHEKMEDIVHTGQSIFRAFEDHDSVRALGLDILLSAIGFCCWSIVSNADAHNMIKCSRLPWLDGTEAAVRDMRERFHHTADDMYKRSIEQAEHAIETARNSIRRRSTDLKRRVSQMQAKFGLPNDHVECEASYDQPAEVEEPKAQQHIRDLGVARRTGPAVPVQAPPRSRSRARASVSPVKESTSQRRSSRVRNTRNPPYASDLGDYDEHETYNVEAVTAKAEAAGLTWGPFVIGGLGLASSAVFGACDI